MRIAPRLRSAGVLARFGVSMLGSAGMRSEMCGWRSKASPGTAGRGKARHSEAGVVGPGLERRYRAW